MLNNVRSLIRKFAYNFYPTTATYEGQVLPARHIRLGGAHFAQDRDFYLSGKSEAELVGKHLDPASDENRIIDLGCGVGRLAVGLMATKKQWPHFKYFGVDVSPRSVDWCVRHLAPIDTDFSFQLSKVHNSRYNPEGSPSENNQILNFETESIDVIYHYSVFSHMLTDDVKKYLLETHRLLRSGGHSVLTLFVEEDCPDCTENPDGYGPLQWKGALHCVRFRRDFFEAMVADTGLEIESFTYGQETDGQSRYILKKA